MNYALLDRLKSVSVLPSLPAVAVRVLELTRQPNIGVGDVAKVISSDPALSAKILRTINSSFYALPMPVGTITHAAALLGLQAVKTLALGFSLASSLNANKSKGFNYDRFWRQSLTAAVAARLLAKRSRSRQGEEAFVAGLLSDIGTLVMHRALGLEYDELLELSQGDQIELVRLSRERFDLDHAQVGGMLAEHWKLPAVLVEPIRQHHNLSESGAQGNELVPIVNAGVLCAQVFAARVKGLYKLAEEGLRTRFGLSLPETQELFAQVNARSAEMAETFELRLDPGRTLADVEDEAREMLMELSLQAQMDYTEAHRQNQELEKHANTDGLTGLANRIHLSAFLDRTLPDARQANQSVSLLFLDLDRFKSINDTYGHQAGDEVLMRLAATIQSQMRPCDLAARYGGEEIVIVLPDTDARAALLFAELLRQRVAYEPINVGAASIPITVSIGLATLDHANGFSSPEALIKAADDAVYAAKRAGRDQVHSGAQAIRAA